MFLFSFQLMNRSIDRWFSPNTSELRDDSSRVVQQLAQYVTSNARVEAESIAYSGAPDQDLPQLQDVLTSHRITLAGGFAMVFDKDSHLLASFQAPADSTAATLVAWFDQEQPSAPVTLRGPLSSALLRAAQRADEPDGAYVEAHDDGLRPGQGQPAPGRRRVPARAGRRPPFWAT